jgi:uncharacterized spore protein YtfJ
MKPEEVQEAIAKARDAITVKRVYGTPFEREGVTVIPAATVSGGAGGGGGENPDEGGSGAGSGFAIGARPVGAYVIENGNVRWEPAFDATRIIGQLLLALAAVALLLARRRP